ncbi:MAG TPA: aminotransferase class V-fold PLP-dependent enzyme [Polyangiaceae bacterium]|nr:aminotransferase class V-fold PLP-dependent enzyme [Polyangiaceae bacterium]
MTNKERNLVMQPFDPAAAYAASRHTFGEHGGVNMSIEASSTFTVMAASTMPAIFAGDRTPDRDGCFLYGRHFNPTVYALASELAAFEATQAAYCTASGLSAIGAVITQLCNSGDHVVASNTLYGGTHALLGEYLPAKAGVHTTFVPISDLDAVEAAFTPKTRLLYTETLANPTLVVADLPRLAEIAHRHGVPLVVDNTFCPIFITPSRFGADVVVHSLTKYISGASDLIAGAVCGSSELIAKMMDLHMGSLMLLGATMDSRIAFELALRLPHLPLRMAEHGRRTLEICSRLEKAGAHVRYPGLESHPQHALIRSLANPGYGFGAIFTVDLGTTQRANTFLERMQNQHHAGFIAVSLGYAETLMTCSAISTSSELDDASMRAAGISPGLVRLSLGYTGTVDDRYEQIRESLQFVGALG